MLMPLLNLIPYGDGPKILVIVTKPKNYSDLSLIPLMKELLLTTKPLLVTTLWLENSLTETSNYLLIPSVSKTTFKISLKS
jgi:hypothetical protein